jgi:HEAT repeat protein
VAENAAIKATRDAAIAAFHGKDEGAADDAMKLLANLAKNGDGEARKVLLEALKSENPYMRELAVEAVGIMANPDDLPLLEAALKDAVPKVRQEAVDWIGNYPPEKSGPILVALLTDADARVVRTAADRLGDMKYEAAKPDLIRLAGGNDESVAVEAAIALRRMGDTAAAEILVPTWGAKSKSPDARERENAVKQLRRLRLESTRVYLEAMLNDENPRVRDEAKKALKQLDKDAGK